MFDPQFVDFQDWLDKLTQATVLWELASLLLCAALAWGLTALLARTAGEREHSSILFGRKLVDGVLFPLLLLVLAYAAKATLRHWLPLALFKLALPVLIALVVIRVGVKVLQAAFSETRAVRVLERSISWVAWLAMVLWVSGLLPLVLEELDQITWKVGGSTL